MESIKSNESRLEWIRAYSVGTADAATVRSLEDALRAEPSLRSLFLEYLNVDGSLALHALGTTIRQVDSQSNSRRRFRAIATAGVAAIVALIWYIAARLVSCAKMIEAINARWENSTLPTELGSNLQAGVLRLTDGLARIRFASGADVTLEGPAELEILGTNLCRLPRGSLIAHVPVSAHGFTVHTGNATLIDHGTDFSLSADEGGHAKVQVIQGEVELRHANGLPPMRLTTREMAGITPEKLLPAMPLEAEPSRPLLQSESSAFEMEITTRSGDGAAAYISQARVGNNQSSNLLLLKSCVEEGYGRKVLLRFDLRLLPPDRQFNECRLVLYLSPTGYGYASRSGDAIIGVYAVLPSEQDNWDALSVTWENQPAWDDDASKVDLSKAVRVGEFIVPQGMQSGSFSIEGEALARAIARDPNRLLTLVLVRENAIQDRGGVVLGIAGNNHPLLPPPTLRFR
jgi:ferric-dicitrate binding protein FerR (iron transport regulator)